MMERYSKKGVRCAAIIAGCVMSLALRAEGATPGIVVADGILTDTLGRYSLTIPSEWSLKDGSTSGAIALLYEGSAAFFSLMIKSEAGTLDQESKVLAIVVPHMGGRWSRLGDGYRKVGGKRASELLSSRTYEGEEPLHELNLVVVYKSRAYIIGCGAPESEFEKRSDDFNAILDSVVWHKKE